MASDQPVIDYGSDKKTKGMGNKKEDVDEMDRLSEEWVKRTGGGMSGKAVKLDDYLRSVNV